MASTCALTQLRNLLAGTRPHVNPLSPDNTVNGDMNFVLSQSTDYYMPNGIAEIAQNGTVANKTPANSTAPYNTDNYLTDNTGAAYVVRNSTPVPGRWGEAQSIPGVEFLNPLYGGATDMTNPHYLGVVTTSYQNPVRAGYSMDIGDILNGQPRDAADDNYNSFDPYPGYPQVATPHTGEMNDADAYDAAGAFLLPVERMRRWLTPADINGTGSVTTWSPSATAPNRGADVYGRVEFTSYFRPPGAPGAISTLYTYASGTATAATGGGTLGAIYYPQSTTFYDGNPSNTAPAEATPVASPTYLPDLTNNPLHGFESFRFPNQAYDSTQTPPFIPQRLGGSPVNVNEDTNTYTPTAYPTYNVSVNASVHSDGLNESDEMNLYQPYPLLDSPFGTNDLEWLYRQQDVDGASLTSRLSQLAPVSFTNTLDGSRRRKLFSLDSWDLNSFVWANDNPGGNFPTNSRFTATAGAGFPSLNVASSTNTNVTTLPYNPTASRRPPRQPWRSATRRST